MKIIYSRLVKDSEWAVENARQVKFPVRSKLHIQKTGSFMVFGLSQEKYNEPKQH